MNVQAVFNTTCFLIIGFCRQYVLNVTPDLPNTFEEQGCGINYLKIPIADHWSQNLAVHFPQAIRFIGQYNKFLFIFKLQLLTMLLCQVYIYVFLHIPIGKIHRAV